MSRALGTPGTMSNDPREENKGKTEKYLKKEWPKTSNLMKNIVTNPEVQEKWPRHIVVAQLSHM